MTLENNDKILSLDEKDKVRKKTAVFIGSVNNNTHLAKEAIANGIDEMYNNFESGILKVELFDDLETISVEDTGRGIPIHTKENRRLLFETTFAGTKLEANEKTTTGTNGCGMTVTQYTSEFFEVQSKYKGINHIVRYENCEEVSYIEEKCSDDEHGTKVIFKLDKEIYPTISYTIDEVKDMTKRSVITTPNIKAIFVHKDIVEEYNYKSLKDYLISTSSDIDSDILVSSNKRVEEEGEVNIIQFVLASFKDEPIQESYLNMNYLPEKGTLHDGLMLAVRLFLDRHIKDKGMYNNKEKSISVKDVESVVGYVLSNLSTKVEYQNQTKFSTAKELYKKISREFVLEQLEYFNKENPHEIDRIANAVLINKRANERASASIDKIKKKLQANSSTINNKIEKFVDCAAKTGGELFITEGDSAKGAIVLARDEEWQAAYPLRGKMKNILKNGIEKLLDNAEIRDIILIMGCGVEVKIKGVNMFDIDKCRWDKIIFATDADPDGAHIFCLGITFMYILCPSLLKDGRIYRLMTPLYEIRDKKTDEMHYAYTEYEKDEVIKNIADYQISRVKGLGEANSKVMEDCINMDNPNYIQVTWDDAEAIAKKMEQWMGEDIIARKEIIAERLYQYI